MSFASLRLVLESTGAAARTLEILSTATIIFPDGHVVVQEALGVLARALRSSTKAFPFPQSVPPPPVLAAVQEVLQELVDDTYIRPRDPALIAQEINGSKVLLLEVVRRAAYDWVLYRTSRRMLHKKLAEDAYTWLFEEKPGHPNWVERDRNGKHITSFLAICGELDMDPNTIRKFVRQLTVKNVMSVGRPAEYRRRQPNPQSLGEDLPSLSTGSLHVLTTGFESNESDY